MAGSGKSKVYFSSISNNKTVSPLNKIKKMLNKCNVRQKFEAKQLIAIKTHFGELGNTAYVRPVYIRPVIEILKELKAKPFLTDTNTLYVGKRANSVDHVECAAWNGFNYSTLQVPVIIADGLRGENSTEVEVNHPHCKTVKLASDILNSDGLVVVSHFKGHENAGFGGTVKNISMGAACRAGKMHMHSETRPFVKEENCTACRRCIKACEAGAISLKEKAYIDPEKCVGCARCISICPEKTIDAPWDSTNGNTQEKMVEYADGLLRTFREKSIFINILTDISPACDCYGGNDKPLVENIGFAASLDPFALDHASYDLVCQKFGSDPFAKEYPGLQTTIQIDYAKTLGIYSGEYELEDIT